MKKARWILLGLFSALIAAHLSFAAVLSPNTIDTTLMQDGQPAGSITPSDMRTLTDSLAGQFNSLQTGNYTFALADRGTTVEFTCTAACTATLPPNASVAFDVGTQISAFVTATSFPLTVAAGAGVSIDLPPFTVPTSSGGNTTMVFRKRATNEWVLVQGGATSTASIPTAAAAAGFNIRTFGPSVTIGTNWQKFSFFGINPAAVSATQNTDGSVTVQGPVGQFGAQLCTASQSGTGPLFTGTAFGGGAYIEYTMSYTGALTTATGVWPAVWANDVENMSGQVSTPHWPGQATGYNDWIEVDTAEYDITSGQYGSAMHNWYGIVGSGLNVSTNIPQQVLPSGTDVTQPHKYGFLWQPATSTTQGHAAFYFDGVKSPGSDVVWNLYNSGLAPPPVAGTSAYGVLDNRHLALILGSNVANPMTVYKVEVWQSSTAGNISN